VMKVCLLVVLVNPGLLEVLGCLGLVSTRELYSDTKPASGYRLGQNIASLWLMMMLVRVGRDIGGLDIRMLGRGLVLLLGVLDDSEQDGAERGKQLRIGNAESRPFKVEDRRHAWNLQGPNLFALGNKARIEREEMPGSVHKPQLITLFGRPFGSSLF